MTSPGDQKGRMRVGHTSWPWEVNSGTQGYQGINPTRWSKKRRSSPESEDSPQALSGRREGVHGGEPQNQ